MRRSLVALALAVMLPLPVLAGQVTVKEGETLSEIAERHGISLTRLMELNGIRDADLVEVGRRLTVPGGGGGGAGPANTRSTPAGTVTVKEGETLSEIAERHGVGVSQLMQINGISDADQLQIGQTLRLPGAGRPATTSTAAAAATGSYPRGASEHVVRSGESLWVIANGYGIGLSKLIALNGISDPELVAPGTRLRLKGMPPANPAPSPRPTVSTAMAGSAQARRPVSFQKPAPAPAAAGPAPVAARPVTTPTPASDATMVATASPDWRTYGPLQVNWAAWQPMGGSMVAPTLNGQGQTLYLAINCGARKLNATTAGGEWQAWGDPSAEHEQQLVNDYCRNRN